MKKKKIELYFYRYGFIFTWPPCCWWREGSSCVCGCDAAPRGRDIAAAWRWPSLPWTTRCYRKADETNMEEKVETFSGGWGRSRHIHLVPLIASPAYGCDARGLEIALPTPWRSRCSRHRFLYSPKFLGASGPTGGWSTYKETTHGQYRAIQTKIICHIRIKVEKAPMTMYASIKYSTWKWLENAMPFI